MKEAADESKICKNMRVCSVCGRGIFEGQVHHYECGGHHEPGKCPMDIVSKCRVCNMAIARYSELCNPCWFKRRRGEIVVEA